MMKMDDLPPRGFPKSEYESRTARAQRQMAAAQLDAILLTAAADISYFSGFITRFWQSPSRPWFLLLPAEGKPDYLISREKSKHSRDAVMVPAHAGLCCFFVIFCGNLCHMSVSPHCSVIMERSCYFLQTSGGNHV